VRRLQEIFAELDALSPKDKLEPILGDLSMILRDPYSLTQIVKSIFMNIGQIIERDFLPRKDEALKRLTQLLEIGLQSNFMLKNNSFKRTSVSKDIMQGYYPILAVYVIDNIMNQPIVIHNTLKEVFVGKQSARKILLYYCLERLSNKDEQSVSLIIDLWMELKDKDLDEEIDFLRAFFNELILLQSSHEKDRQSVLQMIAKLVSLPYLTNQPIIHKELIRFFKKSLPSLSSEFVVPNIETMIKNLSQKDLTPTEKTEIKEKYTKLLKDPKLETREEILENINRHLSGKD